MPFSNEFVSQYLTHKLAYVCEGMTSENGLSVHVKGSSICN